MGTMLQAHDLTLDDFEGHEGCNEILNVTRPDVVRSVHDAYFEVGCDAVETNTFGSNWAALNEYDITDRIRETALAGARIARESADAWSTPDRPRWVLGSVGPGTKLPSLGHAPYAVLRDGYQEQCEAMIEGGVDADPRRDLARTCCRPRPRSSAPSGRWPSPASSVPLIAQVTVELTGTMLLGSEIGAALTALEPLGIDVIGMNCATGPAEMGEHLRYLSQHATVPLSVMPNAGLPQLGKHGAEYPLQPAELAKALPASSPTTASASSVAAAAPRRSTCGRSSTAVRGREVVRRTPVGRAGRLVAVLRGPVRAGRRRAHDRRAHQHQRLARPSARR